MLEVLWVLVSDARLQCLSMGMNPRNMSTLHLISVCQLEQCTQAVMLLISVCQLEQCTQAVMLKAEEICESVSIAVSRQESNYVIDCRLQTHCCN